MKSHIILIFLLSTITLITASDNSQCDNPLDMMLVLDHSASIIEMDWEKVKMFGEQVVNEFKVSTEGAHVGVVQFAAWAKLSMCLTGSHCAIDYGINDMPDIGTTTNIVSGLQTALDEINARRRDGEDNRQVIILLTDGNDNMNQIPVIQTMANQVKSYGITIYCIGVHNQDTNVTRMIETFDAIATSPINDHIFYTQSGYDGLNSFLDKIIDNECVDIGMNTCPAALVLMGLLLLFHMVHFLPIFRKTPRAQKYVLLSHYLIILFTLIVFILACALAATSNTKKQKRICVAIIVFICFCIALFLFLVYKLWRDYHVFYSTKGISRAGMNAMTFAGDTPAGMKTFRVEDNKADTQYSELKDHLDSQYLNQDEHI
ncbi:anthrax toxin receptor-like [Anaeramoeba ignava]|uniref:Anthrax toxin receptor-like n=1 Tax=Anaeramoeba ignava TaxID=1746090 RepID=A0A9Q0LCT3_ANAIG|nr:anthrax toxin receptor-like [Anaeramoeba ignava]|eukprot:Anaeramoba_ignava/c21846_g1_i1.p1 GENE.c21846_g1_i1~~c21846_g1_i1.p1  ORF type:complete len:374 (+),score=25.28 c21846_g1_i1:27-1148(+)